MSKHKRMISSLLVIVMVLVSLPSCSLTSPKIRFSRLIEDGKYDDALNLYREKSDSIPDEDAEKGFEKALDMMYQDYLEDDVESSYIISYINELNTLNIGSLNEYSQQIAADVEIYDLSKLSFTNGNRNFELGFYYSALKDYQKVVEYDPNYEAAQKRIPECIANYKQQKIDEAAELAAEKDYLGALDLLITTVELIGNDDDLYELIEKYHHDYDEYILMNASALAKSGEYDEAIQLLSESHDNFYEESKCDNAILDYKDMAVNELFAQTGMSDLIANGNYKEALEEMLSMRDKYRDAPTLEKTLSETRAVYAEQEIAKVDELMEKYDYKAAYNECVDALSLVPGQEDLISKRDYCRPRLPVPLNDYFVSAQYDEIWYLSTNECKDTHGIIYPIGTICMKGTYGFLQDCAEFNLGEEFDVLSLGLATTGPGPTSLSSYGDFLVYGDGKLLFELKITSDTKPEDKYDIDVSGVEVLDLKFSADIWTLIVWEPELRVK